MNGLANFIEREAGHVAVSVLLLLIGAGFTYFKIPKGEDIIVFSLGVLARSMIGTVTNGGAGNK